jgi:hypothetical protein
VNSLARVEGGAYKSKVGYEKKVVFTVVSSLIRLLVYSNDL